MRVMLINSNRFKQPWPVIPTGLVAVAGAAERAGHLVELLDLCFSRKPARDIARALRRFTPDVVGVSVRNIDNSAGFNTDFLLRQTRDLVVRPLLRQFQGTVIVGGPAVGVGGAELLAYLGIPLGIRGDGELATVELLRRLEAGEALDDLRGLIWWDGERVLVDSPPWPVEDLRQLPQPQPQRFIDLRPYRRFDAPMQIQTKRGCALRCSYCTYNSIEGRRYRLADPQRVADEVEALYRETGIDRFEFTDSTFNLPLDHAKAVLRAIAAKGLPLRLRTMGLNPAAVDEALVELMAQCGFTEVDLGVEAGAAETLRGLGKSFTVDDIQRAAALLQRRHIPVTWYLLIGGPGESAETIAETFDRIGALASPWDLINVAVGLRVYAGTPIARRLLRSGVRRPEQGFLRPVAYQPESLSLDEVKLRCQLEKLRRSNVYLYDEDEQTSAFVLLLATWVMGLLWPRQPVWRTWRVIRTAQRLLGLDRRRRGALRRALGELVVGKPARVEEAGEEVTRQLPAPAAAPARGERAA